MKNFIFISPNFPLNYRLFCAALKRNGINVLGIGDCPYDELDPELRDSLTEYYRVSTLEHYDEVYRAVAYFIHGYGRIDWLESNNEYWLEQDAALRTDFNIPSGFHTSDMPWVKFKSKMKERYALAGIPTARWHLVDDFAGCKAFIDEVGYPVIVKPDNGVGASHTYKLEDDAELKQFLADCAEEPISFIMEEFVDAEVNSYDAIVNSKGEILFEAGNVTPNSIMDIVNTGDNSIYYIVKQLKEDVRDAGRRAVRAFNVRSRFIHFEFFRLNSDQHLGKKGDVVGLEVNMRPCGGYTPDMLNFARCTDVYQIWADMIAFDNTVTPQGQAYYCAFAGRRKEKLFRYSHPEIVAMYGAQLRMVEEIPEALSDAMGDMMYVAVFSDETEMHRFYKDVLSPATAEAAAEA